MADSRGGPKSIGVVVCGDRACATDARDHASASELIAVLQGLGYRSRLVSTAELALSSPRVDACVPCLHGRVGGLGSIQSVLSLRGTPFTGPAANTVATAFDKVRARQMLAYHNLPVPAAIALARRRPDKRDTRALDLLGWPCVVKPRRGSLSAGVARIDLDDDLEPALRAAMAIDDELVLERFVEGREIQIVMLGDRPLGMIEVQRGLGRDGITSETMVCPPRLERGVAEGLRNLARRANRALGLEAYLTRVDILLSPRQSELVLEVEPLPSFAREDAVWRVARAAGIDLATIVEAVLRPALVAARTRSTFRDDRAGEVVWWQ